VVEVTQDVSRARRARSTADDPTITEEFAMSKRLFVGNLAPNISDQELSALFNSYGAVQKAEVVRGRGGKGRGFGYVELASDDNATRAITELNGRDFHGRPLTLAEARSAAPRTPMEEADRHAEMFRPNPSGGERRGRR
jgi:cold-inducible RNA-binding protein